MHDIAYYNLVSLGLAVYPSLLHSKMKEASELRLLKRNREKERESNVSLSSTPLGGSLVFYDN